MTSDPTPHELELSPEQLACVRGGARVEMLAQLTSYWQDQMPTAVAPRPSPPHHHKPLFHGDVKHASDVKPARKHG